MFDSVPGPWRWPAFPDVSEDAAREHLRDVAVHARPLLLAGERSVALGGELRELVPGGAIVRGSVLGVRGDAGAGSTTLTFELAAALTATGEWAAAVDLDGTLGARAAEEAGVALERFAVVRRVPPSRWATVVAALLDGVSLVITDVPRGVTLGDARRLVARAREREAVLVVRGNEWPGEVAFTVHAEGSVWVELSDTGALSARRMHVRVEGRGAASRARSGLLAARAESRGRRRPDPRAHLRVVVPGVADRRGEPPRPRSA